MVTIGYEMRIFIHDYAGHAYSAQLARSLARRGHTVLYAYSLFDQTPHGEISRKKEDPANFTITGVNIPNPFNKWSNSPYQLFKRKYQTIKYGCLLWEEARKFRPDIMLSNNNPLDAQAILVKQCRKQKIKFIFWVQDLYGRTVDRILKKKLPLVGSFIGRYYIWLEQKLLRNSDKIIFITDDFYSFMKEERVKKKICVIENWAALNALQAKTKNNAWAQKYGLTDKICIIYSGTLARKHNPDLLLQLAERLQDTGNTRVIVISEGFGAEWLLDKKKEHRLNNLIILKFQPFEQLSDVLATADILIGILETDAGTFSVPSKILSYLCARRPIVLSTPKENLAARIISQNRAGFVVRPNDIGSFLKTIKSLINNKPLREELGENGRRYAETHFDIEKITDRFEKLFYDK